MRHGFTATAQSLAFPYRTCDEHGRDDDVPHIALIDEVIAQLQGAREALNLNRPLFAAADGHIEEAGRLMSKLEELPCVGGAA